MTGEAQWMDADARDKNASTIADDASRWLIRLSEGPLSEAETAAFEAWLVQDPEHERQYRAQSAAWGDVSYFGGLENYRALTAPSAYERAHAVFYDLRTKARAFVKTPSGVSVAGAAAALVLVFLTFSILPQFTTPPSPEPLYVTQTAEIREIVLADGSVVTLGAASALDVTFSDAERVVTLSAGEAFFDVTPDPDRPFMVTAGDTVVRVLGTKFDVHLGADVVRVAVLEGEVEVIKSDEGVAKIGDDDVKHVLTAGQKVVAANRGKVRPVETIDVGQVATWRTGRLIYVDTPLKDIVADLNRYHGSVIAFGDEEIGELKFTASVRAEEAESMLLMITAALDVETVEEADGLITIRQRSD